MHLSEFSAEYENWIEFIDTFISLIHSDTAIDNMTKHIYLRSVLKAEAAEVIKSVELSGANYEIAWQLLMDRYNN